MSPAATVDATRPVPMGVVAETGETHPQLSDAALELVTRDSLAVIARGERARRGLAVEGALPDPMNLSKTGWCVVFPSDVDPAVRAALQPLLDLRQRQVNNDQLFKVFEGATGVRPGQSADSWAAARGVTIAAPVSPKRGGVPFYMLIVGSPARISFDFQAKYDLQWAVGRLHFDTVDDYASYARHVVAYETGQAAPRSKRLALWMPKNPLDGATPLLAGSVVPEFTGQAGAVSIAKDDGFEVVPFVGDGKATKAQLTDIFRGTIDGGPPALLFTGGHGAEWSKDDPGVQRERQGALVTQEWTRGQPLQPEHYFSGADVPADAKVHGLIAFLFACYGGGCPTMDSYFPDSQGNPLRVAKEPLICRLPQTLLSRGALAVIAHVDRAFNYAFEDVMGTPQAQVLRTPLELLALGQRAGLAADTLNQHWASLAAQLGIALDDQAPGEPKSPLLANLYIARDDAKNYVVLGDPAVRLNTATA